MTFEEMLETLRNPPETGVPENIFEEMGAFVLGQETAHRDQLEGAQHRIAELETQTGAHAAEISRLKAQNFDLIMSTGTPVAGNGTAGGGGTSGDDKNDKPEPTGIDSLFAPSTSSD